MVPPQFQKKRKEKPSEYPLNSEKTLGKGDVETIHRSSHQGLMGADLELGSTSQYLGRQPRLRVWPRTPLTRYQVGQSSLASIVANKMSLR
jgi:hypothetical protein